MKVFFGKLERKNTFEMRIGSYYLPLDNNLCFVRVGISSLGRRPSFAVGTQLFYALFVHTFYIKRFLLGQFCMHCEKWGRTEKNEEAHDSPQTFHSLQIFDTCCLLNYLFLDLLLEMTSYGLYCFICIILYVLFKFQLCILILLLLENMSLTKRHNLQHVHGLKNNESQNSHIHQRNKTLHHLSSLCGLPPYLTLFLPQKMCINHSLFFFIALLFFG